MPRVSVVFPSVHLLVLTCSLSPEVSSATVTIRSQVDYNTMLQAGEQTVRKLLNEAHSRGCNLILSATAQHPSTLQICSQLAITVVQHLAPAEVQRVCQLTGAVAVAAPYAMNAAVLGRASMMRLLQLGNRVCVQLDLEQGVGVPYKSHTLVLAAASEGIGEQYLQALMRAFTLIAHFASLHPSTPTPSFIVPGAGASELYLSTRCTSRYSPTAPSSVGWRVMAAALQAVPCALYETACSEDEVQYARFIEVLSFIQQAQTRSRQRQQSPIGIGQP